MRHPYPYSTAEITYEPGPFRKVARTDLGGAIWQFLIEPQNIHAMVIAVRLGAAPVAAISVDLLAAFGADEGDDSARNRLEAGIVQRSPEGPAPSLDQVKRMIGHMIRQILVAVGAKVRTRNSPARDKTGLFTTSARYDWRDEGAE